MHIPTQGKEIVMYRPGPAFDYSSESWKAA
jgi:hypothetical protein